SFTIRPRTTHTSAPALPALLPESEAPARPSGSDERAGAGTPDAAGCGALAPSITPAPPLVRPVSAECASGRQPALVRAPARPEGLAARVAAAAALPSSEARCRHESGSHAPAARWLRREEGLSTPSGLPSHACTPR